MCNFQEVALYQLKGRIMISWELAPSLSSASGNVPEFSGRDRSNNPQVFSDSHYLSQVIRLLRNERERKGLDIEELATRAKLREGVITKAEKESQIPSCRELRAWAKSLGISWEQLWSRAFPSPVADMH
jgi:ribosome-binding protein aMBF1 (putative translation factor)